MFSVSQRKYYPIPQQPELEHKKEMSGINERLPGKQKCSILREIWVYIVEAMRRIVIFSIGLIGWIFLEEQLN